MPLPDNRRASASSIPSEADRWPDRAPGWPACATARSDVDRWPKVWVTAGSVKSSAGTYTACTEVMAPASVRADAFFQFGEFRAEGRLISQARRQPPQRPETSEPA